MASQRAHLNVKLTRAADGSKAQRHLADTPGVAKVQRVFPDETDEELASLYSLEVDTARVGEVMQRLRKDSSIDFVEKVATRKLIRPRQ